jgi:hypothetical protein
MRLRDFPNAVGSELNLATINRIADECGIGAPVLTH